MSEGQGAVTDAGVPMQVTAGQAVKLIAAATRVRNAASGSALAIDLAGLPNHPLQKRMNQIEAEMETLLARMNPTLFF